MNRYTSWALLSTALLLTPAAALAQSTATFQGYVSAGSGSNLGMGGSAVGTAQPRPAPGQAGLPLLADGREVDPYRIQGFNEAVEQAFPMTPEMILQYRRIFEEQQRAMLSRPQPSAMVDAGFVALEPGETPGRVKLAPGIASVIGFYDATGQAWPIEQYVVGSGENFEVVALGEDSNSLVMTPLTRIGWSNLVVRLRDEPKPVVLHVNISEQSAHFRHDIQIARHGPNAELTMASAGNHAAVTEAGSTTLLSVLTRTDLPRGAVRVPVSQVQAEAWVIGDHLYVRSRHALLSPSWTASLSGPDRVRVYQIAPSSMLLFSVDGRVVRAAAELP